MSVPHFRVPLNLPHAATIVGRIALTLERGCHPDPVPAEARSLVDQLYALLAPYKLYGENPPEPEASQVRQEAAALARELVGAIEAGNLGEDRLGQCVRNLFECLELGEEGALLSLRAGEDPRSPQRPV
ncbi:MAG TPA: hypothetical protein VNO81_05430 [Candidatus Nitrosotenuis sp.]|jgi:hypothetical protein|nr:hypothetical protein [Candidatus Nitrosotenuis sp.]